MKRYVRQVLGICLLLCLIVSGFLTGCSMDGTERYGQFQEWDEDSSGDTREESAPADTGKSSKSPGKMKVHFIDVGQGSSVLVESNGHFMLIDGGDAKASSKVVSYLKKQRVEKLDIVIATHYDSDHLNGVVGALHVFEVKKVIAPDYEPETSRVFDSFERVIQEKKLEIVSPRVGKEYKIGKATFTILAPNQKEYSDANNYSVAICLVNGQNRFVITGDAETESEYEMLENGKNLSCDVYLAGHHGSAGSSSQKFLQAMKPEYTVISVGEENRYGHPSQEAMTRLKAIGTKVFRTDEQGTIVAVSNGKKITWNQKASTTWAYRESGSSRSIGGSIVSKKTEATQETGEYIGNRNSKKVHKKTCSGLPDEKNRVYFESVQEAEAEGYSPCGLCQPR